MQTIRRSVPTSLALVALLLAACGTPPPAPVKPTPTPPSKQPDIVMPPPVGPVAIPAPTPVPPPVPPMTPVSFDTLPGWQQDDLRQAWPAFIASCRVLAKKPQWSTACAASAAVDAGDGAAIRRYFETYFVPNQLCMPDGAHT